MKKQPVFALILATALLAGCAAPAASSAASAAASSSGSSAASGASAAESSTAETEKEAGAFAEFSTTDLAGNAVDASVFAGSKLTMVNVWGTFCGPCLREMPDLGELSGEYDPAEFQIIGIPSDVVDQTGAPVQKMVDKAATLSTEAGATYLHLVPSAELLSGALSKVYAVPTTFFVDSEGNVIGSEYLGARSKEDWKALIAEVQAAQEQAA